MNYCVHVRGLFAAITWLPSSLQLTLRRWCIPATTVPHVGGTLNGAKRADTDTAGGATAVNPRKRREAVNLWFDTPT
ncbi:hypothetical protein P5V15_004716 [Pogonomyrmex californicus]